MHNQPEMKAVSVRLYKYLCEEIVGSEKVVRYKRLYCKFHDEIIYDSKSELAYISSGSMAEGLNLPGSDIDIMLLSKTSEVYENKPEDEENVIILDTENALPGFALLKVAGEIDVPTTYTTNGTLLASSDAIQFFLDEEEVEEEIFEIHGPSLSNSLLHDVDMVACFKCHSWPKVALKWFFRHRPSGWPSQDIISNILSDGVLVVPIGSRSSCSTCNPLEWRFSFSLAEKLLVFSFNHTQLLCYSLLKIFLKEIVNMENILNNILCSYYMKTVLFWILEEDENVEWIPENLVYCFLLCIKRLHYWIVCGYIPNYFIPEHNMVEGKLSQDILSYLALYLENIIMNGNWKVIFSAPSFRNFHNTQLSISRKIQRIDAFNEAILSLRTFSSLAFGISDIYTGDTLCESILYRILRKHLPNSARKMLAVIFLKGNKMRLTSINVLNGKNKCSYLRYKKCLSRILINTFYDDAFGWLLLGAYFNSTQEYHKMYQILLFASNELSLDKHRFSGASHVDNRGLWFESYQFLNADFPDIHSLGTNQSLPLFFFLIFLYSRKRGSSLATQSALKLLEQAVNEKSDTLIHWICIKSSYDLLHKAFELSNDKERGMKRELEEIKAITSSDKFDVFIKWVKDEEKIKLSLEIV